MQRPGWTLPDDPALQALVERHVASAATALAAAPGGRILFQPVTQLGISATDIRARRGAGRSVRYLVPEGVLALLDREGLYAPPHGPEQK